MGLRAKTADQDQSLEAARVSALYRGARPAYATTLLNAAILVAVLWGARDGAALLGWYAALLIAALARVALHRSFGRSDGVGAARGWERRFALGALASGAIWAYAPAALFPDSGPLLQMAVVFVVGGSIIGAAGIYAASRLAFYAFAALPSIAIVAQLLLQPDRTYKLLGMAVIVFGAVMIRVYRDIHGGVVEALRTRLRNQELIERLAGSEARLRDAIESFPEAIAVWDDEDRLIVCDDAYARLYGDGRGPDELAGISYREIARNAYQAEHPCGYEGREEDWIEQRLQQHHEGSGVLRQFQARDGRWKQGKSVRTGLGGCVSVVADITDLKRAQDAYLAVLAEENLVLDTLPVGVAFVERRVILRCNRRLEQMLGYGPGEMQGKPTRVWFSSDEQWDAVGEEAYRRLAGGEIVEGDSRLARRDGTRFWCRALGRSLDPASPQESAIFVFSDASERIAAEQALRTSEALYRNLVATSNDLIWSIDLERRWTYLNPGAAQRIYGFTVDELVGRALIERSAQAVRERDAAVFGRVIEGERVFDYETRHTRRDGSYVDLSFNATVLRDAKGAITGATGTAHDVSEQKRAAVALHENVEKLRLAVDAADLYYWEWDLAADKLTWGRDPGGLIGRPDERSHLYPDFREMVHPQDRERYLAAGRSALASGEPYAAEFRVVTRDGEVRWVSAHGSVLRQADGAPAKMIGVSQDVTERKRQEEEVRFLAYHDTLTGLPNRRLLDDRMRQAVYLAQRRDGKVAALLIDLDDFKQVNDALGHRAGDAILRELAQRLSACMRKADTLARHGGDEFVALLPDMQRESDCQFVAEKALRALEPEFRVDGRAFRISASIGISVYPADARDGETLLRNADVAMYHAKQLGGNQYRFYGR
jgi:diguanylate cyclase (GGDEF)-like protein/PAS domain S-box-containing protein